MEATTERMVVLRNVPGAMVLNPERFEVAAWEDVCHRKNLRQFIDYEPFREVSRWVHAERKRPYVLRNRNFEILKAASTLDAIVKAIGATA